MTLYRHTQIGRVVISVLALTLFGVAWSTSMTGLYAVVLAVAVILLICTVMFSTLTVEVNESEVSLRFGPGPIRKSFANSEIRGARAVRNRWYYGWGIRKFPGGWLYNVSGLDAVELVMHDGRLYRVGTDEPQELLAAIRRAGIAEVPGTPLPA